VNKKLLEELYEEFCTCRNSSAASEELCFKMCLEKYSVASVRKLVKNLLEDINGRD